jgi:hypothetical protein
MFTIFFAASSSILSGIFWLLLVFTNVGNPITKLAFGNGLYHPCMIVLGMVYCWVYHIIPLFDVMATSMQKKKQPSCTGGACKGNVWRLHRKTLLMAPIQGESGT